MEFGTEFLDVTSDSPLPFPVQVDRSDPGSPIQRVEGVSNVKRFRGAIRTLLTSTDHLQGGVLYLPPGRYLIENDLPDEWDDNLWDRHLWGERNSTWRRDRNENPFGASLRFPASLTLWLAPGAVLVPARDAIVHIESVLVCEPLQIFNPCLSGYHPSGKTV